MKYVASFDIGLNVLRGILLSSRGQVVYSKEIALDPIKKGDSLEQDPREWYEKLKIIGRDMSRLNIGDELVGIILSGQVHDLILLDQEGRPLRNAILYADARAESEAREIKDRIRDIEYLTANSFNGASPLAKLYWIKRHEPLVYKDTYKILLSSKDYCILGLTGEYVGDFTSASTSGMVNLYKGQYEADFFDKLGLSTKILPRLSRANERVGSISRLASLETGFREGTPVYLGAGNIGITSLINGLSKMGEVSINLDNSGWIGLVSENILQGQGIYNLLSIKEGDYINIVPFINAGNVHKWILKTFYEGPRPYESLTKDLKNRAPGSNGVFFLPYLKGETFPINDEGIKAGYFGIGPDTKRQDLVSSALEGVAYSIRQGLERLPSKGKVTLIGGGTKEEEWGQILSDILGREIVSYLDTDTISAMAMAGIVFQDLDIWEEDHLAYANKDKIRTYRPNYGNAFMYDDKYNYFISLYPRLRNRSILLD